MIGPSMKQQQVNKNKYGIFVPSSQGINEDNVRDFPNCSFHFQFYIQSLRLTFDESRHGFYCKKNCSVSDHDDPIDFSGKLTQL